MSGARTGALFALLVAIGAFSIAAFSTGSAEATEDAASAETAALDARISLPDDFRARRVHLGSWFVPEGDASGFHDVYTDATTVSAYRKAGVFPDGAVLVKELRPHVAGNYTTGAGVAHATSDVKQWFVMVKDSTNRFAADDPAWGEGWGWALFKPDAPDKNTVTDFRVDCLGCHAPARARDWVYIEGYPTLAR